MITSIVVFVAAWLVSACVTLWIIGKFMGEITVEDLVFAIIFGPIATAGWIAEAGQDVVIWRKK